MVALENSSRKNVVERRKRDQNGPKFSHADTRLMRYGLDVRICNCANIGSIDIISVSLLSS